MLHQFSHGCISKDNPHRREATSVVNTIEINIFCLWGKMECAAFKKHNTFELPRFGAKYGCDRLAIHTIEYFQRLNTTKLDMKRW